MEGGGPIFHSVQNGIDDKENKRKLSEMKGVNIKGRLRTFPSPIPTACTVLVSGFASPHQPQSQSSSLRTTLQAGIQSGDP